MKYRINFNGGYNDSVVISGDNLDDITAKAKAECERRGWDERNCWDERIDEGE